MADKVKAQHSRRVRLSSKNQVTIPVGILRAMGVRSGDELEIAANGRQATIRPAARAPWLKHAGSLTGVWPVGGIDSLRGEWEPDHREPAAAAGTDPAG